jgi:long-chain acyl-CoA synthetase
VVGWESPVLGEEIAAFVVLCGTAAKADLTAWCRRKLAPTKQPRDIFIRDTLPYNTNGKILKRELKAALPPIE